MFDGGSVSEDDEDLRESEEDKEIRIKEEQLLANHDKKWNWYQFAYVLAKGSFIDTEKVFKMNFIFALTHKMYEIENKKIAEYYDTYRFKNQYK